MESEIEVCLNTTGNVEFLSTSEGNGTCVLLSEDFLGNINVRIGNYTVGVFDGKMAVTVNHTFLGAHVSLSGWGYERFRYTSPTGASEILTRLFLANKKITLTDTPECIIGDVGTWHFELDTLQWGELLSSKHLCPASGMTLFVADVKLP